MWRSNLLSRQVTQFDDKFRCNFLVRGKFHRNTGAVAKEDRQLQRSGAYRTICFVKLQWKSISEPLEKSLLFAYQTVGFGVATRAARVVILGLELPIHGVSEEHVSAQPDEVLSEYGTCESQREMFSHSTKNLGLGVDLVCTAPAHSLSLNH